MKRFIKKVAIFCIPFAPIFILLAFQGILFRLSGENTFFFSTQENGARRLVGYKYDHYKSIYYKYQVVSENKFDIVAIGASRILQFRKEFFNRSFYAWNMINYSADYMSAFHILKDHGKLPKFILLQLDERTFSKDFDIKYSLSESEPKHPQMFNTGIDLNKSIISDWFSLKRKAVFGGYSLQGLGAQYYFSGYRSDGSYQYGKLCYNINYNRKEFDSTFSQTTSEINSSNTFFNVKPNPGSFNNLSAFLDSCTKENIHVLCFFQRYPSSVISTLKQRGFYPGLLEIHKRVENILKTRPHIYLNIDSLPDNNDLFIDGIHPNEKANMALLSSIPKVSIFRTILNEPFLAKKNIASKVCVNANELAIIKQFFESTGNY